MRWFRICKTCADLGLDDAIVEVASKRNSGLKHCVKHKVMPKGKDRKRVNNYRKRTSTKNGVSSQAIERARRISEEHRNSIKEVKVIVQSKTDDQLIQEFLKNNKPTIIENKKDEYIGGKMNIRGEY